jgi:hypothetical protein
MLRSPLPHAPARTHGAAAPSPHVADVPLACGPPEPRPPARLPPPPAAWLGARAGLSSERSARPLPASVRAASGTALVIFTASLVVSGPALTWPASAPSPAVQAAKVPWLGTTAAAGAQATRTLPTCTIPPPLSTPWRQQQPCHRCRCSRRRPSRRQARMRRARLD